MTAVDDLPGNAGALAEAEDLDTERWMRQQAEYWDAISRRYDELYTGPWSQRENAWVQRQLSFVRDLPAPTILDLGCGTGLGLRMVGELNECAQYFGVDVSQRMVAALAKKDGVAKIRVGSMEDLSFLDSGQVDVVLSLFSSVSYAYDPEAVLREVSRVLAPGGYAYLSVLSVWAMSRIRSGIHSGLYRTRGDHLSGKAAPVRRQTVGGIRQLSATAGLTVERITGMNVFSGLAEWPSLWSAGQFIARKVPNSAHTIEVLLRKES